MQSSASGQHPDSLHASPPDATAPFAIETENLVRNFGAQAALRGVRLQVRAGEFFSLLGPSGCGKTTLLRLIAGLDIPDEGSIRLHGADVSGLPAHQRPVNTVFQSYALFPHLTVRENVAFGLRVKKVAGAEITRRVERIMEITQIGALAERKPQQLSGGEKQRVALARAVVNEPKVLLLDEPLGALDLKLRQELQQELHQLQRRLDITFLYVTHDQNEALAMSDRIAVMNAGQIEQLGTARELYENPRTRFTAQFLGSCNLIPATWKSGNETTHLAETPLGILTFNTIKGTNLTASMRGTLAIRPERVMFGEGSENTVRASLQKVVYCGAETHYFLVVGALTIKIVTLNLSSQPPGLITGRAVTLHFPRESLRWLEN